MSTKRNLFRRIAQLTAREARTTDHIVVTGADGHDALIPIVDITDVDPVGSASQIAAIRIQTSDGTQHSATVGQLVTVIAPALPKESDLAAVPSIDEIAHIRIITKAGGSRKATPAQAATLLAPLLAIDYSLLTEQAIPGEYFVGRDGSRKQVYGRLFKGTLPAPNINATTMRILLRSVNTLLWCRAFYIEKTFSDQKQLDFYVNGGGQLSTYISFDNEANATNNTGQPYYAYCKYTL